MSIRSSEMCTKTGIVLIMTGLAMLSTSAIQSLDSRHELLSGPAKDVANLINSQYAKMIFVGLGLLYIAGPTHLARWAKHTFRRLCSKEPSVKELAARIPPTLNTQSGSQGGQAAGGQFPSPLGALTSPDGAGGILGGRRRKKAGLMQ